MERQIYGWVYEGDDGSILGGVHEQVCQYVRMVCRGLYREVWGIVRGGLGVELFFRGPSIFFSLDFASFEGFDGYVSVLEEPPFRSILGERISLGGNFRFGLHCIVRHPGVRRRFKGGHTILRVSGQ